MRSSLGLIVVYACLLMAGCSGVAQNYNSADQEVLKLQNDPHMVASDWYRKGYITHPIDEQGRIGIFNSVFLKMLGLHAILWLFMAIYIQVNLKSAWQVRHPNTNIFMKFAFWCYSPQGADMQMKSVGAFMYFAVNLPLAAIWVAFWLLGGVIIPIFYPDAYMPFDFVGFLTLVGFYATIAAYLASRLMRSSSSSSMSTSTGNISGAGRTVRAMAKALFVAVASGVGGKLGGWIGGILVFVLSAGVSAFFELPSQDHD
jgi:hypothetical protein